MYRLKGLQIDDCIYYIVTKIKDCNAPAAIRSWCDNALYKHNNTLARLMILFKNWLAILSDERVRWCVIFFVIRKKANKAIIPIIIGTRRAQRYAAESLCRVVKENRVFNPVKCAYTSAAERREITFKYKIYIIRLRLNLDNVRGERFFNRVISTLMVNRSWKKNYYFRIKYIKVPINAAEKRGLCARACVWT